MTCQWSLKVPVDVTFNLTWKWKDGSDQKYVDVYNFVLGGDKVESEKVLLTGKFDLVKTDISGQSHTIRLKEATRNSTVMCTAIITSSGNDATSAPKTVTSAELMLQVKANGE